MIYKNFETNKIDFNKSKIILFYGKNDGLKNETIKNLVKDEYNKIQYDEKDILENTNQFLDKILNKSLFDTKEAIIVKRASDKILNLVKEIISKDIKDLIIIINADNLEKKSKLRSFFEKSKKEACVAFYPDNDQTLLKMASNFLKRKNIAISYSDINVLVNKSRGDRESLAKELDKIESYAMGGNKLSSEKILKLSNLFEDYDISELIDNCLAKNKNKIIKILSENNFSSEDSVNIIKIFLYKSKKILSLINQYENNSNIDLTISSAKPPIFWKDKEITKQQIYKWKSKDIKKLIYKLCEIEFLVKKDTKNALNLINEMAKQLGKKPLNMEFFKPVMEEFLGAWMSTTIAHELRHASNLYFNVPIDKEGMFNNGSLMSYNIHAGMDSEGRGKKTGARDYDEEEARVAEAFRTNKVDGYVHSRIAEMVNRLEATYGFGTQEQLEVSGKMVEVWNDCIKETKAWFENHDHTDVDVPKLPNTEWPQDKEETAGQVSFGTINIKETRLRDKGEITMNKTHYP